ncbi:MAG: citrate lyase holo-[acyl-carrier protein] synthase [Spirochaeta sp.]|jgi:holo-ACP synthase CitX|nr:citrate lyase holo-[acyl-carrier protein] synthase [Spirochaeta sp.]
MSERVTPAVLHAILQAREERAAAIAMMAATYNATVVAFTLNVPGPQKNLPWTAPCLAWGRGAFVHAIQGGNARSVCRVEWQDITPAGPEYRCAVDLSAEVVKRTAIAVEESCRMGRLLDIDVYDAAGRPVTRGELGYAPRRCLLCSRPAHECARSRRHPAAEIAARIEEITAAHHVQHG